MPPMRSIILLALLALPSWALAEKSDWPTKRKADPEWGEDLYNKHCWQCHGRQAEGDGPSADALQVPVPSLRGTSNDATRSDLIATARQGIGPMPAYHESISRQDMRRVFIYIESLDNPKKKPAKDESEEEADGPTEEGNAPDAEGAAPEVEGDAPEDDAPDAEGGE